MRSPKNVKEAQRLARRITSLSRFLPRIIEITKPIMNLLRKKKLQWNDECEEMFQQLTVTLATPLVLLKPSTSKRLIVFFSVSAEAISAVLLQEENNELRPIYFVC